MATGYCTLDDLRRALREKDLPGDISQDNQIAIDAIAAQTEWLEKQTHRHWYVPGGVSGDSEDLIPTDALSRDDEHDIPTHGGFVLDAYEESNDAWTTTTDTVFGTNRSPDRKEQIRLAFGDLDDDTVPAYTRIRLARKDVTAINELSVVNADGGFDDWASSSDYDGGVGNTHRGEDYWVRVNNGGVSELYLDVHAMDDEIASLSKAVYVDFDFGYEAPDGDDPKLRTIRRGVAFRAASDFVEEAVIEIPQNATIYNVETKADELREKAAELLEPFMMEPDDDGT